MTTIDSTASAYLANLIENLDTHPWFEATQVDLILDRLEAVSDVEWSKFQADPLSSRASGAFPVDLNPFAIQSMMDPRAQAHLATRQSSKNGLASAAPLLFLDPQLLSAMILMNLASQRKRPGNDLGQLAKFLEGFSSSARWTDDSAGTGGGFRDANSLESAADTEAATVGADWISQYDSRVPGAGDTACYRACREMARHRGTKVPPSTSNRIQVATSENGVGQVQTTRARTTEARHYIDAELAQGRPVTVGVSHKASNANRDGITDHFVLITAKGIDERGKTFYEYHDPATRSPSNGANKRFYADAVSGNLLHAGSVASGYVVNRHTEMSMVVRNA